MRSASALAIVLVFLVACTPENSRQVEPPETLKEAKGRITLITAANAPNSLALAPSVLVEAPPFVPLEGETFTTDVTVENTKDLLGFQFDVNFDPAAFAVESVSYTHLTLPTNREV